MKPNTKKTNLTKELFKLIANGITALIFMLIIAILMIASDMAEHTELSDYEPGTSAVEIAADIIKTIV